MRKNLFILTQFTVFSDDLVMHTVDVYMFIMTQTTEPDVLFQQEGNLILITKTVILETV